MMKRDGEGYVPDANDKLPGTPPTSGSALTPVECASCKALRQRIEELERQIMQMSVNAHYRICGVCGRENRNEASEWGDICPNCWEEETTNLSAATKHIEELEAKAETLQDNAELGRLVRQMPDYTMLRQMKRGRWEYWDYVFDGDPTTVAYSPEAALEKALGEEQNERT